MPLVTHLVKETQEGELVRLLTEVLPDAYFDSIADDCASIEEAEHLVICHRAVHDSSSEFVCSSVARNYYEICCKAPEWKVILFEEHFFRGVDLGYLEPEQIEIVKKHLLARCKSEQVSKFSNSLIGIGAFLTCREAADLFWEAYGIDDDHLDIAAIDVIVREYVSLSRECRELLLHSAAMLSSATILGRFNNCEKYHFKDNALPVQEPISDVPF